MRFRILPVMSALLFASPLLATEFPTGTLQGAGFIVEKGGQEMTDKDLYTYRSSANVVKQLDGRYRFTINAHMQRTSTATPKDDERVDVYKVIWKSPSTGELINSDNSLRADKTSFAIANGQLVIKSWISRNQLWETQVYSLSR